MTGPAKPIETTGDGRGFTVAKETRLWSVLAAQREAFVRDGSPSPERRRSDLLKLKQAILARRRDYEAAIDADFGHRSAYETAIMEIMPTVQGVDYLRRNLRRWMRPRARRVALQFRPGTARVVLQPLGVVGIISPWNYPAGLCLMPLATAHRRRQPRDAEAFRAHAEDIRADRRDVAGELSRKSRSRS